MEQVSISQVQLEAEDFKTDIASAVQELPKVPDESTFKERCKAIEPATGALLSIAAGISERDIKRRCERAGFNKTDSERTAQLTRPTPEGVKATKEALARIIARRTDDTEALDIAIVSAFAIEVGYGYYSAVAYLKSVEAKGKEKTNEPTKA